MDWEGWLNASFQGDFKKERDRGYRRVYPSSERFPGHRLVLGLSQSFHVAPTLGILMQTLDIQVLWMKGETILLAVGRTRGEAKA